MSHEQFSVVYDGPALEQHTMDVRDLAPALLAIGAMLEEANHVLNGERAKVAVQVKGSFKTGCFRIDLAVAQQLLEQIVDIFNNRQVASAKELLEWLGIAAGVSAAGVRGLFALIKWLRGRRPSRVELLDNGTVKVYADGESFETERAVISLYQHYKLRKALEDAITKPLAKDGMESFAIVTGESRIMEVAKSEAAWFAAPAPEDEFLEETEVEANLQLVNIAFRDDNKWRFSDGASVYFAAIEDLNFLERVNKNEESFFKGDILRVRLRKKQWLSGEDMKTEYTVTEVLDHRKAGVQLRLPFEKPDA